MNRGEEEYASSPFVSLSGVLSKCEISCLLVFSAYDIPLQRNSQMSCKDSL